MILIKLTRFYFERPDGVKENDKDVWVNLEHISVIRPVDAGLENYTELLTNVGSLLVKESPKEIMEQIVKLGGGGF